METHNWLKAVQSIFIKMMMEAASKWSCTCMYLILIMYTSICCLFRLLSSKSCWHEQVHFYLILFHVNPQDNYLVFSVTELVLCIAHISAIYKTNCNNFWKLMQDVDNGFLTPVNHFGYIGEKQVIKLHTFTFTVHLNFSQFMLWEICGKMKLSEPGRQKLDKYLCVALFCI